jgi:hypothetical protein
MTLILNLHVPFQSCFQIMIILLVFSSYLNRPRPIRHIRDLHKEADLLVLLIAEAGIVGHCERLVVLLDLWE